MFVVKVKAYQLIHHSTNAHVIRLCFKLELH